MELLTFLGTANAISDENHENSHLLVQSGATNILVDSPGNPISRLLAAGFDPIEITHIVLTHFHADHISGLPLLLMDLWLLKRKAPLKIFGLRTTIEQTKALLALFSWEKWENLYPVEFIEVSDKNETIFIDNSNIKVTSTPVKHLIPTIGIKCEFPKSQKKLVYSSDSEPCSSIQQLAKGVHVLIHEAAGYGVGHSSAQQCGELANLCEVEELYLIHYPTGIDPETMIFAAKEHFNGKVFIAEDFNKILFA